MADTTVLLNNAIVRNATVGASPPHGIVKTGELPLVQLKPTPGGPQVRPEPKAVQILPPKDANSAVAIGGLPQVKIKNTLNGPQIDDGHDRPVVIRDAKHKNVGAGGLPIVQVKMTEAGREVQTVPTVQDGPPRIQSAVPALSQPRVVRAAAPVVNQGYVAQGPTSAVYQACVVRVAAPASNQLPAVHVASASAAPQMLLPPVPELTTDQLMLCHHLVDKYRADLIAAATTDASKSAAVTLAEGTIATLDDTLIAVAVRAEAAAANATAAPVSTAVPTIGAAAATSIAPSPSISYTAGRVVAPRQHMVVGSRTQRSASLAPRRTARGALPPVIVKMEGQRAVVQNQAEIAAARATLEAQAAAEGSAIAPPKATHGPLPPVIVKMEGQRAVVQNQAEIDAAKAALAAQVASEVEAALEQLAPQATEGTSQG